MTSTDHTPARVSSELVDVDRAAILRHLGLDPTRPATHALVAVAERFGLDPLLGHVTLIPNKGGAKVYVTRDGLLHVAHASGQLDGIVVDELREGESGFAATVSVWRKDMSRPFTYSAGCGHQEPQARDGHGSEMALARAERRALARAFDVGGVASDDPGLEPATHTVAAWDVDEEHESPELDQGDEEKLSHAWESFPPAELQRDAHRTIGALDAADRDDWCERHDVVFAEPWPEDVAVAALELAGR